MESSARAGGETSGRKSRWLWWFVSGLVLGVLGTIFLPDLLRPYLPDMLKGENVEIAGVVEAKSREADRLLLTIGGDAGAVLVTYTHEIPEMDLLIEPGDSVVLAVREYAPFVEDPSVRRVQKGHAVRKADPPAASERDPAPSEIRRRELPTESAVPRPEVDPDSDAEFRRDPGPEGADAGAVPDSAGPSADAGSTPGSADRSEPPRK